MTECIPPRVTTFECLHFSFNGKPFAKMKIVIVDDNALFRQSFVYVLRRLEEDITILEASNFDAAMQHVSLIPDLDLVLLDLHMPGKDGYTTLKHLSKNHPTIPVVILSASDEHSDIQRSLDAGAVGYISKASSHTEMLKALRLILSGETYVPP